MDFENIDVRQSPSAADIVFEALRVAIISGTIEDGTQLQQEAIAKKFNTSRSPVREALARLEAQGLVEAARFRGATVAGISPTEVDEIFDLRAAVESSAIRRAVPVLTEAQLAKAEALASAFSESQDPKEWIDLNRRFHCSLYDSGQARNHMITISGILDRIDRYLLAQLTLTGGMTKAIEEHTQILQACTSRNAKLASRLTAEHVVGAKESLLKYLAQEKS
ncbi:transcriptional regulator, GntR type (plasmid) [Phaeobacter inhibens]|uniref:GntR family transcriptional regulator n=1 Tax=Phaeobacter inhibens TaxID=221822 RepID=UPI000C9B0F98|nr:GntR family transcriptional regulator [Phaeobacter inhibens]AUQ60721.1 transcriptional regulator, GntR type [Phaeobacter inhibens]